MMWVARTIAAAVIAAAFSATLHAEHPAAGENLYKAEVIVTGTGEQERARGFREGLKEIFIKLTGDASLEESSRLDPFLNEAGRYIREYSYEDRMKHLPIRDEQGTRDRPHYLRMTADRGALAEAIKALGLGIWQERPQIEVLLTVKDFKHSFLLGAESEEPAAVSFLGYPIAASHYDGYEQREVLKSIAARRGLTIELPKPRQPVSPATHSDTLFAPPDAGPPARFRGDLTVLPSGFWKLTAQAWATATDGAYADAPQCFSFEISEVSFDVALRKSLDAFALWLQHDKNATACGFQRKS